MRFRLREELNEDTLQQNLKNKKEEQKNILNELSQQFEKENFEKQDDLNGITFVKNDNKEESTTITQFYIDKTDFTYSGYISTETDQDSKINFSIKGDTDNIIDGANKLIDQYKNLT